jgi:hypothetical protein
LKLLGIVKVASVREPGSRRLVRNLPAWRIVRDLGGWKITDPTTSGVVATTYSIVVFMFIQFRSVYPFHVFTILPNIFRERIGYWILIVRVVGATQSNKQRFLLSMLLSCHSGAITQFV